MFQDELVVRSPSGFELTLRGRKILQELEQVLPKIEGLVVPSVFDPKKERSSFRISGPDNVCMALLPHLCRRYATERCVVRPHSRPTATCNDLICRRVHGRFIACRAAM
jgi:DNA-binding transcriptional LysR family regulator